VTRVTKKIVRRRPVFINPSLVPAAILSRLKAYIAYVRLTLDEGLWYSLPP
jgi:hypothetical protein